MSEWYYPTFASGHLPRINIANSGGSSNAPEAGDAPAQSDRPLRVLPAPSTLEHDYFNPDEYIRKLNEKVLPRPESEEVFPNHKVIRMYRLNPDGSFIYSSSSEDEDEDEETQGKTVKTGKSQGTKDEKRK